jgi:hypothetical protein
VAAQEDARQSTRFAPPATSTAAEADKIRSLGEKRSLSALLPPRWVLVGGRQRKEGGEMMRKEGGRRGRGGAGGAEQAARARAWWPAGEQRRKGIKSWETTPSNSLLVGKNRRAIL